MTGKAFVESFIQLQQSKLYLVLDSKVVWQRVYKPWQQFD